MIPEKIKVWPDFPASDFGLWRNWVWIGFVFLDCEIIFFSVILCYKWVYIHFGFLEIGFDWVWIGFALTKCPITFIFISYLWKDTYVHLTFSEIGFVLHNSLIISYVIFRRLILVYRMSYCVVQGFRHTTADLRHWLIGSAIRRRDSARRRPDSARRRRIYDSALLRLRHWLMVIGS